MVKIATTDIGKSYSKEIMIAAFEKAGANRWTRGEKDRLYVGVGKLGYTYETYKTGNISSACLNDKWISNGAMSRALENKTYIDINNDFTLYVESTRDDEYVEAAKAFYNSVLENIEIKKLEIQGITMRYNNEFRVMIKATDEMRKEVIKMCDGDASYLPEDNNTLYVEIGILVQNTFFGLITPYSVMYFFDEYKPLNIILNEEQINQIVGFIETWKDKIPDNEKLALGDCEWLEMLSDDIEWKKKLL